MRLLTEQIKVIIGLNEEELGVILIDLDTLYLSWFFFYSAWSRWQMVASLLKDAVMKPFMWCLKKEQLCTRYPHFTLMINDHHHDAVVSIMTEI